MFPWIIAIIVLGWTGGAAINYLADVLPTKRKLVPPFCLNCEEQQEGINYFLWPRRCPACSKRRSPRTWIVEMIAIAGTTWLWLAQPTRLPFALGFVLLVYFGVVVVIDLEHRLILHPVSIAGGVLGLVTGIWLHGVSSTLLGGVAGFASMFGLYLFGIILVKLLSVLRGRGLADGEALGFGDVNLSGVIGLMLGYPGVFVGLFLAIILGGLGSLLYMLAMLFNRKYQAFSAIPYGPFLVAGAVLVLFFSNWILHITR